MSECLLVNSGASCLRSAICGLSTAARVMVWLEPPPPPAPEHAAPTRRRTSPATSVTADLGLGRWSGERSFLSVMERLPLNYATYRPGVKSGMTTLSNDNVVCYNTDRVRLQQES